MATLSLLKLLQKSRKMQFWTWRSTVAPCDAAEKNHNMDAQLQPLACTKASNLFWKIYFLCDFWCTQTCLFRAIFGLPMRNLTINCCQRYIATCGKNLYRCTSTFLALNYCEPIGAKFRTTMRNHVPLGCAKFHVFHKYSKISNFTWIGATSRPCGAKMLIIGLWVKTIRAVAASRHWCR